MRSTHAHNRSLGGSPGINFNRILSKRSPLTLAAVAALGGLIAIGGCTGLEGTIAITVVTAPDSDIKDQVVRARLTTSDPPATVEAERGPDGSFALSLDLEAGGGTGTVTFEGFDESGALVAFGRTPPLPIQAVNVELVIYVAPPMSLAEAPVTMPTARSEMAVAPLPYAVVLAGGRQADQQLSTAMEIYNPYTHEFQFGVDMPNARAGMAAVADTTGAILMFGGVAQNGQDTASFWRFDTNAPPAGNYSVGTAEDSWARSGARGAAIGQSEYMLTGDPALTINSLRTELSAPTDAPALAGETTTVIFDGQYHTLFIGAGNDDHGGYRLREGTFDPIDEPALRRLGHATVLLPDGVTLALAGRTGSFLDTAGFTIDPRSNEVTRHLDLLTVARTEAAVAATDTHIVVAGGLDSGGAVVPDAEILDAATLTPITSLPLAVPRHGAHAVELANGQIAIFGGLDASDAPVETIELFTPTP